MMLSLEDVSGAERTRNLLAVIVTGTGSAQHAYSGRSSSWAWPVPPSRSSSWDCVALLDVEAAGEAAVAAGAAWVAAGAAWVAAGAGVAAGAWVAAGLDAAGACSLAGSWAESASAEPPP